MIKALTIEDMEFLTPEARLAYYVDMNEALIRLLDSLKVAVPAKGTFEWAKSQAEQMSLVRRSCWPKVAYWFIEKGKFKDQHHYDITIINADDVFATDWEVVE